MSRQIEIAVVGEIEYGVLIAGGLIENVQRSIRFQGVGDLNDGVPGETLIAVGAGKLQRDGAFRVGNQLPQPAEEKVRAGVEVVAALIGGHMVGFPVQIEGRALEPVGVPTHGSAETGAVSCAVALTVVVAQHHVGEDAVPVGDQQRNQRRAGICDGGGQLTTGYCVEKGLFAGGQSAERFFHEKVSFHFWSGKKGNYVKTASLDYTIFRGIFQTLLLRFAGKTELSL